MHIKTLIFLLAGTLAIGTQPAIAGGKNKDAWTETVSPDVKRLIDVWKTGAGDLQPVNDRGVLRYPYGHSTPEITCAPEHICTIRLRAGEKIINVALGDSARWMATPAKTGSGDTETPLVIVKPTNVDISTNMLVTTTAHTYTLVLHSVARAERYDAVVGYYWPEETVQDWSQQAAEKAQADADTVADMPNLSVDKLNFNYAVTSRSSQDAFNPVRVFDDGSHVYLQMPETMRSLEAPALVVLGADGKEQLVNYRLKNGYYVVDRLFDKAALLIGVGSEQSKVVVEKIVPRRSVFSLF